MLQPDVIENMPQLDEGIYSDSNDSMTFDNTDKFNTGQQKLVHHVKVLDDHLDNLRSKLS